MGFAVPQGVFVIEEIIRILLKLLQIPICVIEACGHGFNCKLNSEQNCSGFPNHIVTYGKYVCPQTMYWLLYKLDLPKNLIYYIGLTFSMEKRW